MPSRSLLPVLAFFPFMLWACTEAAPRMEARSHLPETGTVIPLAERFAADQALRLDLLEGPQDAVGDRWDAPSEDAADSLRVTGETPVDGPSLD